MFDCPIDVDQPQWQSTASIIVCKTLSKQLGTKVKWMGMCPTNIHFGYDTGHAGDVNCEICMKVN